MRFKTSLFISGLAALSVGAGLPAAVSAAPQVSVLETPWVTPIDPSRIAAVAVGGGTVAWAERDAVVSETLALRTRDAAGARTVTQLTGVAAGTYLELEVGHDARGSAIVAVTTRTPGKTVVTLVRLADGQRRTLPARIRSGKLGGVGIDRGWIYATRTTGSYAKAKSSLWRARITGLEVGSYTQVRTASRTEAWSRVAADRNRVAVLATRSIKRGGAFAEESWLAGTPRGKTTRVGQNYATDGGYEPLLVAGFTADRRAVVTVRSASSAPAPLDVQRVPLAGGKALKAQVVSPMLTEAEAVGFDGDADRLVAVGPDPAGTMSLGTAPAPWDAD